MGAKSKKKGRKKRKKGKKKGGSQIKIDGQMRCLTGRRFNGARSRLPCVSARERERVRVCALRQVKCTAVRMPAKERESEHRHEQ